MFRDIHAMKKMQITRLVAFLLKRAYGPNPQRLGPVAYSANKTIPCPNISIKLSPMISNVNQPQLYEALVSVIIEDMCASAEINIYNSLFPIRHNLQANR
jgi:hypothetical protein